MSHRKPTTLEGVFGAFPHLRTSNVARMGEPKLLREQKTLTSSQRTEMLEQLKSGSHVELEIEIVASAEPAKPLPLPVSMRHLANANFSRFHTVGLKKFIRSFRGRPMLRDHAQETVLAAGGEILSSQPLEDNGGMLFVQRSRLVADWAVRGVLDGTIKEFSIGWLWEGGTFSGLKQALQCSVCRTAMFGSDCMHWPGDEVQAPGAEDDAEPVIVEALWLPRHVYGIETSAVLYPAVEGTGIHEMRAALSALKARGKRMDKILKELGLSEDSSRDDAVAAIRQLKAGDPAKLSRLSAQAEAADKDKKTAETLLSAEREAHDATRAELSKAREQLAEVERASAEEAAKRAQAEVDALVERAKSEGRIVVERDANGDEVATALERSVRAVAEHSGLEVAADYVGRLAKIAPISQVPQSRGVEPGGSPSSVLSDQQKQIAKQLGVSEEAYANTLKQARA